jgi:hypothetical protein
VKVGFLFGIMSCRVLGGLNLLDLVAASVCFVIFHLGVMWTGCQLGAFGWRSSGLYIF